MSRGTGARRWRDVNGLLLLDKPLGLSSNQALQKARRLLCAEKGGHTGSLDPLASGMLPLCFGQATKVCAYLLDADKRYTAVVRLGSQTSTGDREGEVVATAPVPERPALGDAIAALTGPLEQVPPMYSALKVDGERLYALARRGIEVAREARRITIHSLEASLLDPDRLRLDVHCSKGTYIRTLGEDFARLIGTVGHLESLRREWAAPFRDAPTVTFEVLEALDPAAREQLLLPAGAALPDWPCVALDPGAVLDVRHGRAVPHGLGTASAARDVRLYAGDCLVALGVIPPGSDAVRPVRLLAPAAQG